jgi:hypothetical protein
VGLPGNGEAARRGGDFKQHHPARLSIEFVDFAEAGGGVCALGDLVLEAVQPFLFRPVVRADDLAALIVHAEDEPRCGLPAQVGLIAEGGEILADVGGVVVVRGGFELNTLVLPRGEEALQNLLEFRFGHDLKSVKLVTSAANVFGACFSKLFWSTKTKSYCWPLSSAAVASAHHCLSCSGISGV